MSIPRAKASAVAELETAQAKAVKELGAIRTALERLHFDGSAQFEVVGTEVSIWT